MSRPSTTAPSITPAQYQEYQRVLDEQLARSAQEEHDEQVRRVQAVMGSPTYPNLDFASLWQRSS